MPLVANAITIAIGINTSIFLSCSMKIFLIAGSSNHAIDAVAAATPIPDDIVYIPLGLAKYSPKKFFAATLLGKIVLCYVIVLISHYMGLSLLEPVLQDIEDPLPVYVGIIILGIVMTVTVILLLRLNWERILGRIAPWTLDDNDDNNQN